MPPRKGAVQKTQWLSQTPVMSAGPKARAGLMHMLLTEPSSHISSGTMRPTESGPSLPQPLQRDTSILLTVLGECKWMAALTFPSLCTCLLVKASGWQ